MRSPQRLASVLINDLQQSLQGDPAIRVTDTGGRRLFGGGGLSPQTFVRPAGPNDPAALAQDAGRQINTRLALNRSRGKL